jgi:hypothetical protein
LSELAIELRRGLPADNAREIVEVIRRARRDDLRRAGEKRQLRRTEAKRFRYVATRDAATSRRLRRFGFFAEIEFHFRRTFRAGRRGEVGPR